MKQTLRCMTMGILFVTACGSRPPTSATGSGGCATPRDVAQNPDGCLVANGTPTDPSVLTFSHYREMVSISVRNLSAFKIGGLVGEITWINTDGTPSGTVPFTTKGIVPPGGETLFNDDLLRTKRIESNAPSFKIHFTQASVVED